MGKLIGGTEGAAVTVAAVFWRLSPNVLHSGAAIAEDEADWKVAEGGTWASENNMRAKSKPVRDGRGGGRGEGRRRGRRRGKG